MDGSLRELRQMAHVSAQISHDHMATAFHFLISKRGGAFLVTAAFLSDESEEEGAAATGWQMSPASAISMSSAIFLFFVSTMV